MQKELGDVNDKKNYKDRDFYHYVGIYSCA